MKDISEHNREKYKHLIEKLSYKTGIQCPHCGEEMLETNPSVLLMSKPPQKNVHCPSCKYKTYIVS